MESMIEDLLNPEFLPDQNDQVFLIQTHISWVLIGDRFVYKIKKPVNFGFLDFSAPEKRHYYCQQEIALNRRLSNGVYIDVLQVLHNGKNHRMVEGEGRIVDYAVRMKRLPEDRFMKKLFSRGELNDKHLTDIAKVLSKFYLNTRNSKAIDQFGKAEMFKVNTDENFEQTQKYIGKAITQKQYSKLKKWTDDFFHSHGDVFHKRVRDKRIRDCHGDLHMEHICFADNIQIFDCIEFNERFRYIDTLLDIAFLLMDLEYHGGDDLSNKLWESYKQVAGEKDIESLLTFYKVYRAYVRGKVTCFQLDDTGIGEEGREEAVRVSKKYFSLASSYIQ